MYSNQSRDPFPDKSLSRTATVCRCRSPTDSALYLLLVVLDTACLGEKLIGLRAHEPLPGRFVSLLKHANRHSLGLSLIICEVSKHSESLQS